MVRYAEERCADCSGKKIKRPDGSEWCPNCALFNPGQQAT